MRRASATRSPALWSGAREVLRTMSYYEMKNRAGVVGKNGLGPLLAGSPTGAAHPPDRPQLRRPPGLLRAVRPARRATGAASPVKSLTLIQGAFSHFTFASTLPFDGSRGGGSAPAAAPGSTGRCWPPSPPPTAPSDGGIPAASMLARQDSQADDDVPTAGERWGTTDTSKTRAP